MGKDRIKKTASLQIPVSSCSFIKPAPEILAADEPAHILEHIFGNGMPEHFLHEFWFQGDNHISPEDIQRFVKLESFSLIVSLKKGKDGAFRGTRNIKVVPAPAWRYEKE